MDILDFIVCDDIRTENNGKHILIGVYSDLRLKRLPQGKWPVIMKLSFFIRLNLAQKDKTANQFSVKFIQNGKDFADFKGPILLPKDISDASIVLNMQQFQLPQTGKISFKVQLLKNDNIVCETIPKYQMKVSLLPQDPPK